MELYSNTIIGHIGRHTAIQISDLESPFHGWIMAYEKVKKENSELKSKLEKQLKINEKIYGKYMTACQKNSLNSRSAT